LQEGHFIIVTSTGGGVCSQVRGHCRIRYTNERDIWQIQKFGMVINAHVEIAVGMGLVINRIQIHYWKMVVTLVSKRIGSISPYKIGLS